MSADSPKDWKSFVDYFAWGSLVFSCGMVAIEKLFEQSYGQTLAALIAGGGIAAVALHSREWLQRTNPNWAYAGAVVITSAVISTPFVEEKRWPFSDWFPRPATAESIADAVVAKLPNRDLAPLAPSVDAIANAVIGKLPQPKDSTIQIAQLQTQLADAQRAVQSANQDAAAARSQLGDVQKQLLQQQQIQQSAQMNQFAFSPPPIKKRRLTHSEAVDLIDKLAAFSLIFRSLDKTMSNTLIIASFPHRFGPQLPNEIDQKKGLAVELAAELNKFRVALQEQISDAPGFKVEVDEMLGGQNWLDGSSLNEILQVNQNYIQTIDQIVSRPTKPDDELINYILRDPQASFSRPSQKFNSWRSQIPNRILELQNEAREDL